MIRHFSELFPDIPSEELFAPAKPKDLDALVELFGGRAERVIEFYRQYEPHMNRKTCRCCPVMAVFAI